MDVTYHKTKSFFVRPTLQGEKALEEGELSFMSLPYLFLQDVEDLSDEVITNGIEPTHCSKTFFGKNVRKDKSL